VTAKTQPTTGALRLFRAAVLTAAMLILTVIVHTKAHGDLPSAGTLLVLVPLVFALSALLLGRQRGYSMLIAFSVGTQALLHVLLTVGAGHESHHDSLMPSSAMTLAHTGAAICIALILARADALLHRWIEMALTALFSLLSVTLPTRTAHSGAVAFVTTFLSATELNHAIHRRGPPVVICN
jgi:hypothetical protein